MTLNDSDTLFDNTTVTAGWNAKTYTVTINPNGASGSSKTYSVSYGQQWQVPSCPFSRTGYNFSGYTGGYSAGQTITITGNIIMSCQWTAIPQNMTVRYTVKNFMFNSTVVSLQITQLPKDPSNNEKLWCNLQRNSVMLRNSSVGIGLYHTIEFTGWNSAAGASFVLSLTANGGTTVKRTITADGSGSILLPINW